MLVSHTALFAHLLHEFNVENVLKSPRQQAAKLSRSPILPVQSDNAQSWNQRLGKDGRDGIVHSAIHRCLEM